MRSSRSDRELLSSDLFETRGEAAFRELEEEATADVLSRRPLAVVELGGGALASERTRTLLAELALSVHIEIEPDEAWDRVSGTGRPLARDPQAFRALYDERLTLYEAADASARDLDGVLLAAAGIRFAPHGDARGDALVADGRVAELHDVPTRLIAGGKTAAEAERLWRALQLDRGSTLVALGGGTTTDVVGFVAATYMRGIDWIAVPSTLVGQVDAAIGGKVGIDLPEGKNLVGAFHWPTATVIDTTLLDTLPGEELQNGLAEVVEDRPPRGRAAVEARHRGAGAALRRVQGGGLPTRSIRAGGAGAPEPWPHVRACARGRIRLSGSARPRSCARPPGSAARLGAR